MSQSHATPAASCQLPRSHGSSRAPIVVTEGTAVWLSGSQSGVCSETLALQQNPSIHRLHVHDCLA